jgi:hypothetical protein
MLLLTALIAFYLATAIKLLMRLKRSKESGRSVQLEKVRNFTFSISFINLIDTNQTTADNYQSVHWRQFLIRVLSTVCIVRDGYTILCSQ